MKKEQIIGCTVQDCKYCDCEKNKCQLKEIKIRNSGCEACKENTICDSYKKR